MTSLPTKVKYEHDEIGLLDVIDFFQHSWNVIVIGGLGGALVAGVILFLMAPQFEATSQVQMAQASNRGDKDSIHVLGANVEDPSLLATRLKLPSTYTSQVIQDCGVRDSSQPGEVLANLVKATPTKNVPSVIEIRIQRESPELAVQCSTAIFNMIRQQQEALIQPFLDEAKKKIVHFQEMLKADQVLLTKMEKNNMQSAVYLATRDEITYLAGRIESLNTDIAYRVNHKTKLIAPIYSSHTPVFPKRTSSLLTGLFVGLMLGVIYAFFRRYPIRGNRTT